MRKQRHRLLWFVGLYLISAAVFAAAVYLLRWFAAFGFG